MERGNLVEFGIGFLLLGFFGWPGMRSLHRTPRDLKCLVDFVRQQVVSVVEARKIVDGDDVLGAVTRKFLISLIAAMARCGAKRSVVARPCGGLLEEVLEIVGRAGDRVSNG